MTKPRKKPSLRYLAFIVEPEPGFKPTNWQQTPQHYRVIQHVGSMKFLGSTDAWKFLHNHKALKTGQTGRWAIFLDMDNTDVEPSSVFVDQFRNTERIDAAAWVLNPRA